MPNTEKDDAEIWLKAYYHDDVLDEDDILRDIEHWEAVAGNPEKFPNADMVTIDLFVEKAYTYLCTKAPLKLDVTGRQYQIEIPLDDFMIILRGDVTGDLIEHALPKSMEDVDYGGHSGPCINFSIRADWEYPELHQEILDAIEMWLAERR